MGPKPLVIEILGGVRNGGGIEIIRQINIMWVG